MDQVFKAYVRDYIYPGKNEEKAALNDGTMVTVICVTYAHEDFITQTLDSIVSQKTNFKFKVFVGEDCGSDRTAEIVLSFADKYPDIVIPFIRAQNMGPKKNLVDLINHATSPYICFCDGDDYWIDEYKLQKQYDYMELYPTVKACFARARIEAPDDWYFNNYFKADQDGNRIMPDCLPGFKIPNRLLNAVDIIKFHPMHTVTVFYRWDYEIGFPQWFFYGVLGDIPMSLLQIGDGKVAFLPDLVGVYRRSNVGVHMFSDKDEHFIQTRGDYLNYLQGISDDFSYRFGNYAKVALENRIKQEWNNLIRAALRCERLDVVGETIKQFPYTSFIVLSNYCTFFEDGKRMYGNYGREGYQLLARNRMFLHGFAPIIKSISKFRIRLKILFHTNWIKKFLKLPYLMIDRMLPNGISEAYNYNSWLIIDEMTCKLNWDEFFIEAKTSKIIICGFGPGVWSFLDKYNDKYEILCIIGFGENRSVFRNIPIIEYSEFINLRPDLGKNITYLLSECHPSRLAPLLEYMKIIGIHHYFSYCYMESLKPEYYHLRKVYALKYNIREMLVPNGLFKNDICFNIRIWLREKKLISDWKIYNKLSQFKGIHEGETCYIVGTGPSLTIDDINLIRDKISFSVNGIFRLFQDTSWRPTYYAICDPNACVEALKYFKERNTDTVAEQIDWDSFCRKAFFMPESVKHWMNNNLYNEKGFLVAYSYLNQHINPYHSIFKYCRDIDKGSYNLRTVVNFCINIADYMGFKKIVLLGVDCDYCGVEQYFDGTANIHVCGKNSPYKALLTQREMVKAYQYIKAITEKENIQIYNATRGGHLEVFKRIKLEEAITHF